MRLRIISAVSRSAATTTMRLVSLLPRVISMVGRAVTANISAGIKNVMITNARERTRSRYSRLAMMKVLCIAFAHRIDKDFFQRRLHQLKLIDPRSFRHHVQQLLRVRARRQPHLHIIAVVVVRAHQRIFIQEVAIAFIFDLYIVLAVACLDGFQVALQHRRAFINKANAVAQLLHLVHAMRGKQDGLALLLQAQHHVLQQAGIHRIKPEEWLVHDDEIRIVQQCGDELDLLLHALGKLFHFFQQPGVDLQSLAPLHGLLFGGPGGHAVEFSQEHKLVQDLHLLVQSAFFRQVADLVQALALERLAKKVDLAGIRHGNADHHADGAGLYRSVRPQQPKNPAMLTAEGKIVDRHKLVIRLADFSEFNGLHEKRIPPAMYYAEDIPKVTRFPDIGRSTRGPAIAARRWGQNADRRFYRSPGTSRRMPGRSAFPAREAPGSGASLRSWAAAIEIALTFPRNSLPRRSP